MVLLNPWVDDSHLSGKNTHDTRESLIEAQSSRWRLAAERRPGYVAGMASDPTSAPAAPPLVAIIGGGPAGLMAAETVAAGAAAGALRVVVYDHMPSLGRKLLMAGRGGLNLTHTEPLDAFLGRYGAAGEALAPSVREFPPGDLRAWCEGLGQETFVGSSGRVFPRAMKASPLLRAWLRRLDALGVGVSTGARWTGWDDTGALLFRHAGGEERRIEAAACVLALGGASWPRLGSDGGWTGVIEGCGVQVTPLGPSNVGVEIAWSQSFRERFAGEPLKPAAFTHDGRRVRGEAVVTAQGLEGGAIYALSAGLRRAIERGGPVRLDVDLRPDATLEQLAARLAVIPSRHSLSTGLRKALKLSPAAIGLLREDGSAPPPRDPGGLAARIKAVGLQVTAMRPLDHAISTAGGVALAEVDPHFMLRKRPGTFVAGEMLDWEAPTGGYLLQACFATGRAAGEGVLRWLGAESPAADHASSDAQPARDGHQRV